MVEEEKKPFDVQAMLAELDASIDAFKAKMNTVNEQFIYNICRRTGHEQDDMKKCFNAVESHIEDCADQNVNMAKADKPVAAAAASAAAVANAVNQRKATSPKRNGNPGRGKR